MDELNSFAGVIALWLGISVGSWWLHRLYVHARQRRNVALADQARALIIDAQAVFDDIRTPRADDTVASALGAGHGGAEDALRLQTHALLRRVQMQGDFFDTANALRARICARLDREDYPPLSELLNLRRDLWAAAEVVLIEEPELFGDAFPDAASFEHLRAEAWHVLTKQPGGGEDPFDLRLGLIADDAAVLLGEVENGVRGERERERLPSLAEIAGYPVAATRVTLRWLRSTGQQIRDAYLGLRRISESVGARAAFGNVLSEVRRARERVPERLAVGLGRASGAAREHIAGLNQHYDFLIEAHKIRIRYEAILRRAPDLSEAGRQFITRMDLERRAEQLREQSVWLKRWTKRVLVRVLGRLILWLEWLRDRLIEVEPRRLSQRPQASQLRGPDKLLSLPAPPPEAEANAAYGSRAARLMDALGRARGSEAHQGEQDQPSVKDPFTAKDLLGRLPFWRRDAHEPSQSPSTAPDTLQPRPAATAEASAETKAAGRTRSGAGRDPARNKAASGGSAAPPSSPQPSHTNGQACPQTPPPPSSEQDAVEARIARLRMLFGPGQGRASSDAARRSERRRWESETEVAAPKAKKPRKSFWRGFGGRRRERER